MLLVCLFVCVICLASVLWGWYKMKFGFKYLVCLFILGLTQVLLFDLGGFAPLIRFVW